MSRSLLILAIVGLLITVTQSLSAQEERIVANRLFYAEFGGPGVVMSVNYDACFDSNTRLGFGYRLGIGYGFERFEDTLVDFLKMDDFFSFIKGINVTRTFYTLPVGLNYIVGKPHRASTFEIGGGVTLLSRKVSLYNYELEKPGRMLGHLSFMYRLAPVNGGFMLRIGITPIIGTAGDLYPMGAVCFGYAF